MEGGESEDALNIQMPVAGLSGRSVQRWLFEMPVRLGGMGVESQEGLRGPAFIGGMEMALPSFGGDGGICPPLGGLIGDTPDACYRGILASGCRTGRELAECWGQLQREAQEVREYLGENEVSPQLQVAAEAAGGTSTDGSTRKELFRER